MGEVKRSFEDVDFGDEIPFTEADVGMEAVHLFAEASGMMATRFTDHDEARKQGLPGAIVPGIMSQGIFASKIHAWAPGCEVKKLDTVFRAQLIVDSEVRVKGVVTDMDEDERTVELDLTMVNEKNETPVIGTAIVGFA